MLGRAIGRSENEKWHRLFARNFQGIAYQATVDLEPVFVGGAVETITGYTADEFLTGTVRWDAVVHPDDLPRLQEETDSLQAIRGSSVDRIYRILRRDDTVRWIRDLVWNVCDDDGTPSSSRVSSRTSPTGNRRTKVSSQQTGNRCSTRSWAYLHRPSRLMKRLRRRS